MPDPKFGEELCVWVIVKAGASLNEAALQQFCSGQIAPYKIPRYIKFVDASR